MVRSEANVGMLLLLLRNFTMFYALWNQACLSFNIIFCWSTIVVFFWLICSEYYCFQLRFNCLQILYKIIVLIWFDLYMLTVGLNKKMCETRCIVIKKRIVTFLVLQSWTLQLLGVVELDWCDVGGGFALTFTFDLIGLCRSYFLRKWRVQKGIFPVELSILFYFKKTWIYLFTLFQFYRFVTYCTHSKDVFCVYDLFMYIVIKGDV